MDTNPLVDPDIKLGQEALAAMSADPELRIRAALWWFDENKQQWLFAISTPFYEQRGAQATYLRIRKILETRGLLERLPLDRVWVIDDHHPVLEIIREYVGQPAFVKFYGNVVNGTLLPNLYIYKIEKRRSRPRKKPQGG
jgi:hypothetical protein